MDTAVTPAPHADELALAEKVATSRKNINSKQDLHTSRPKVEAIHSESNIGNEEIQEDMTLEWCAGRESARGACSKIHVPDARADECIDADVRSFDRVQ
jgi:hypothetical protein